MKMCLYNAIHDIDANIINCLSVGNFLIITKEITTSHKMTMFLGKLYIKFKYG